MIRIFAQAFDFGNIFSESKTSIDEDKKQNLRMEVVQKAWFSQRFDRPC